MARSGGNATAGSNRTCGSGRRDAFLADQIRSIHDTVGRAREHACRGLIRSLQQWVPAFVERRIRAFQSSDASIPIRDIGEDALQHLVISIFQQRTTSVARSEDALAKAWCKRVLSNFVQDELRKYQRIRNVPFEGIACPAGQHTWVSSKREVREFLLLVQRQAVETARARDKSARSLLVQTFFARNLSLTHATSHNRDETAERRYRRGRQLARSAWAQLATEDSAGRFRSWARALDLE